MADLNRFKPRENRLADIDGFAFGCAYEEEEDESLSMGI